MRILATMLLLVAAPALAGGLDEVTGAALFERLWVPAPASTRSADGLGPLHDARSCAACHPGGGRARAALVPGATRTGLVVRLADDPVYGRQLQRLGTPGVPAEGSAATRVVDGRPSLTLDQLAYGPVTAAAGWRAAPSLRGLAALVAVSDADILAREDPDDRDGDGVRGRAHRLADGRIGRFGWKATAATVEEQVEAAFSTDLGLSTAARPAAWGDCTSAQTACRAAPAGGAPEVTGIMLGTVVAYLRRLPTAAPSDPPALRAFHAAGCAACHAPVGVAFTDLLLHDMGPGLDDGVVEGGVPSALWRTPPLRGLGRGGLLHDARAPDIAGAVAWHGGEAAAARDRFAVLPAGERAALLAWLARL